MLANEVGFLNWVMVVLGVVLFLSLIYAAVVLLYENESRAAGRAFLLSVVLPIPYLATGLFDFSYSTPLSIMLLSLTSVFILILVFPTQRGGTVTYEIPQGRIDERDVMFSRRLLEPGSDRYEEYYKRNSANKELDDRFRALPGLLEEGAKYYNPLIFAAADSTFSAVESFYPSVEGRTARNRVTTTGQQVTTFIKHWALEIGAVSVGIAELKDYHFYSTVGRGVNYGQSIEPDHKYAVALTVEMDKYMLDRAPLGPAVMESAQQYLAAGAIAIQIAGFIRNLGYPARAHIDANYRVVCPLVARDAGLGDIGRMGLLMTPELGPRVRISAVTTDLPLIPDQPGYDSSVVDFCTHCRKCADVCPSAAIPDGDRSNIDGVRRWQINSEDCFTFWCSVGTDCGRCISVCPYSHPRGPLHNLIRAGVRRFPLFRRLAIWMDDFFYGRKPHPADLPDWMKS